MASRKNRKQVKRDVIAGVKGDSPQQLQPRGKKRTPQVPQAKEHKAHEVQSHTPYITGEGNVDAVPISRNHNGNVHAGRYRVGTPGVQAEAAPKKERKNPKAKFTWQERIDMQTAAAVADKPTVQPRTEVDRYDPETLRYERTVANALARSKAVAKRAEDRKLAKLAKREHIADMLSRKVEQEYLFPVIKKEKKVKKVVTAEMHKENKRAAEIAKKLHRAECLSNADRNKKAWMERASRNAA